eukprot:1192860-Prorocentrum_minimum.AAC.9
MMTMSTAVVSPIATADVRKFSELIVGPTAGNKQGLTSRSALAVRVPVRPKVGIEVHTAPSSDF